MGPIFQCSLPSDCGTELVVEQVNSGELKMAKQRT